MFKKKNIKWAIFLIMAMVYMAAFKYRYDKVPKPDIRYYDKSDIIENGGFEYKIIESAVYDEKEMMEKFDLEPYEIHYSEDDGVERKFVVVKHIVTKISEEVNMKINSGYECGIRNQHWTSEYGEEITSLINAQENGSLSELKVSEKLEMYQVFCMNSENICESVWDGIKNDVIYFQFNDNKYYPYIRRVRIL